MPGQRDPQQYGDVAMIAWKSSGGLESDDMSSGYPGTTHNSVGVLTVELITGQEKLKWIDR